MRWVVAAAALLVVVGVLGCTKSSSTPSPHPDSGMSKDAPSADSSGACPNDDGARNLAKGQACRCGLQCTTGFCADGYCCDKACDGLCLSCGLATALGTCTPTPAGVGPRFANQCNPGLAADCALDGTCDGAGQCRNYESGTICTPGKCDGDAVTSNFACNGARACQLGASTVCAPFSCNPSTNQCFATCGTDSDCVLGRRCVKGTCGKKMNGALCPMGDSDCASENCADGVCCNTACGGPCRSCNLVGLKGTCSPVPAGKGHTLCALQAPSTCGTTGVCDGFGICAPYPATTVCGPSSCAGPTTMNTAQTCDGMGACQASEIQQCGRYKCANGGCISKCTSDADCADGNSCVVATGSCGPKLDGQKCAANTDCQNQHCVDGVCCNTACTGACRSCALAGAIGKCTMAAAGAADPRLTCADMTAATCGTDGKCDGTGGCRKYAANTTVCSAEACVADVYTGPSTCNASGQCIKPAAQPCYPYHCNATKCFSACTKTGDCISPNSCGMNGNISSCGPKPPGAACSANNECGSSFCAQGVCCNSACGNACQACNLPGTVGSCTNVASGTDPQGKCAVQAQTTCGTNGQCAAGQCARWASGSQCVAASCPTASTRAPASTCNGTGTCVAAAVMNCAPGRCAVDACVNTCTTSADCTAPATCGTNGTCGLQPKGGACTATSNCAAGLTCYLAEGANGVCCDTACGGTCESCKLAGSVGTCSAIPAGMTDPDPTTACVASAGTTCGLNGKCAGNNTATNGAGTARCQFYGAAGQPAQGCRDRSCVNSTVTGGASTETMAGTCNGSGTCVPPLAMATMSCGSYKCLTPASGPIIQCATGGCTTDADCVGQVCTHQTGLCGIKQTPGQACMANSDCSTNVCAGGFCCMSACTASDQCHTPGVCMTGTGACTNPAKAGTPPCDDGNECTQTDTCQAGVCTGSGAPSLDDGNPCTIDACDAVNGVSHTPGNPGTICRASAGLCDVPEMCTGTSASCPVDAFKAASVECRASAGTCDVAETCSGSGTSCPSDSFKATSIECRASAGACDVAENCSGSGASCPSDLFKAASIECRASAGVCDIAENCSGSGASCPSDSFKAASIECRASTGECDPAEFCAGAASCPANDFSATDGNACGAAMTCLSGMCL